MRRNRNKKKYGDTSFTQEIAKPMTLLERTKAHQLRHPNDKNERKSDKGITWSKKTEKDKALDEFHKNHIYTYVDANMNKGWVRVATNDTVGEEE
jgi:hypothetical protein